MAKAEAVKEGLKQAAQLAPAPTTLEALLKNANIKKRFEEMLGKKAPGFISSIISVANQSKELKVAEPLTVIAAAAVAASLDLPINPSLGFAHLVPYSGKAAFQMGWRGYVQLGMRSGQYEDMNTSEVYEDELDSWNPITGEIKFTDPKTWKMRDDGKHEKVVGYVAFFKLLNGFRKYLYMSKAQMNAHAQRFSQSYNNPNGQWKRGFDGMGRKTVLKLLLSKFGIMSIEMQRAVRLDQAIIREIDKEDVVDYPDNPQALIENAFETPVNEQKVDGTIEQTLIGKDGKPIEF